MLATNSPAPQPEPSENTGASPDLSRRANMIKYLQEVQEFLQTTSNGFVLLPTEAVVAIIAAKEQRDRTNAKKGVPKFVMVTEETLKHFLQQLLDKGFENLGAEKRAQIFYQPTPDGHWFMLDIKHIDINHISVFLFDTVAGEWTYKQDEAYLPYGDIEINDVFKNLFLDFRIDFFQLLEKPVQKSGHGCLAFCLDASFRTEYLDIHQRGTRDDVLARLYRNTQIAPDEDKIPNQILARPVDRKETRSLRVHLGNETNLKEYLAGNTRGFFNRTYLNKTLSLIQKTQPFMQKTTQRQWQELLRQKTGNIAPKQEFCCIN